MKRFLPVIIFFFVFGAVFQNVSAQRGVIPGNFPVNVNAQVGEFYINISGYTSPFASIIMTVDGEFVRSASADQNGVFYISQIFVKKGFSHFCLAATDFKRLGESEACLDIEPVYSTRDIKDIFLPPTIGLLKKQVNAGEDAQIYGYSVPNSTVIIKTKDGDTYTVQTDSTGYYSYTIKNAKAGTYVFTASGRFNSLDSLPPTKEVTLNVLSVPEQIQEKTQKFTQKAASILNSTLIGFIIFLLLLILIIIILIMLLRPGILRAIFDKLKRKKRLHHDWFLPEYN